MPVLDGEKTCISKPVVYLRHEAAPLTTATRPAITSTVGALSDRELLRDTSNLVRERHLQGAIIDHLAEINARGLYLERGFSSLFDYAVRELGYSDAAAARRIGAMRLCADQPDAREGLRDGSLTLSAAAELQWAFARQRRRGSISRHRGDRTGGVGGTARLQTPRRPYRCPPPSRSRRRRWCWMRWGGSNSSKRRPARAPGRSARCWPTWTRSWRRRPTGCARSATAATS